MPQKVSKRTKMIRDLVSEVVGLSPYERRLLDMLKTGGASAEKRMYKFAKRRVSACIRTPCCGSLAFSSNPSFLRSSSLPVPNLSPSSFSTLLLRILAGNPQKSAQEA